MMYYILQGQEKVGPLSIEELKGYNVNRKTEIWHEGLSHWVQVGNLPEVVSALQLEEQKVSPSMNAWMYVNIAVQLFVTLNLHITISEESGTGDTFYAIMMSILAGSIILNLVSIFVLFQRKFRLAKVLSVISCIIFIPIGIIGIVGMNKAIEKAS